MKAILTLLALLLIGAGFVPIVQVHAQNGTTLYQEVFNSYPNGSQPLNWYHDPFYSVQNGKYQTVGSLSWNIAFYQGQTFTDFNYTETATGLSNCGQQPPVLGIAFRIQNRLNLYFFWLDIDKVSIIKMVAGHMTAIGVGHKNGITITPLGTFKLNVVVVGSDIKAYVNGIFQMEATDATFSQGFVGVNTYHCNSAFDNLLVTS